MYTMTRRRFLSQAMAAGAAATLSACQTAGESSYRRDQERYALLRDRRQRPHIVFILADDMGWGDAQCFNPESAIPTPHMNRLAAEGLRLLDCHSPGAVCTPSRYGFLTGQYHWRLGLERMGLDGYSANIVDPQRETVASLLRKRGYYTACVGKWHLGMGVEEPVDYAKYQHPNPTTFGFDYYFGIPASLDMAPYLYMENGRTVEQPTGHWPGTPRGTAEFMREGPMAPGFDAEEVLPVLTRTAVDIIDTHGASGTHQPLFLYVPMNAPHTPWLPVEHAQGRSDGGRYGDFVWQVDDSIGSVIDALERNGMTEDTLLIVASDNGGLQSWLPDGITHRTNGPWRGEKGDAWEGGHRVPFIARWPGRIAPGTTNASLVCLTDMLATFADITGEPLPSYDERTGLRVGEDSLSFARVLFEGAAGPRETLVLPSVRGLVTVRYREWKLIQGLGSGGLTWQADEHRAAPGEPEGQLYNLADDPGESNNLWGIAPDTVTELEALLAQIRGE